MVKVIECLIRKRLANNNEFIAFTITETQTHKYLEQLIVKKNLKS